MNKENKSELIRLGEVIEALRDHNQNTVRKVAAHLNINPDTAHRYMKFLVKHGWASIVDAGRYSHHIYNQCRHCRSAI